MREFASSRDGRVAWRWWLAVGVALAALFLLPQVVEEFSLLQLSVIAVLAMLGLSEGFLWGFVGILSFGQTALFGLGGYTFAVAALNLETTSLPLVLAVAVPAFFALILGYFMIYGRIGDVYLS